MNKVTPHPQIRINLSSPGSNAAGVQIVGTDEHPEVSFASSPKGGPADQSWGDRIGRAIAEQAIKES